MFKLLKKYKINKKSILAHSDIAPFRKKDPGKKFPWQSISSSKLVPSFKKLKRALNRVTYVQNKDTYELYNKSDFDEAQKKGVTMYPVGKEIPGKKKVIFY